LAKLGVAGIPSNLATAIRTAVVLVFAGGIAASTKQHQMLSAIKGKSLLFLVLSGVGTGAALMVAGALLTL
jgi:bacterial/archaeal transporter family protein